MLILKIKNNRMYPKKKFWNLWKVIRWVTYSKGDLLDSYAEWCLTLLRANNINDGINFDELQYLPKWFVEWDKILKNGDIIFCMSSGSRSLVWKNTIVPELENHSFGAFCSSFRINSDDNINYIGYFLKSETYKNYIYSLSQWVNILNLRGSDLESLEIPLPPLSTQSRIVARLDSAFASIDEQISLLRANIEDVENMRKSVLEESFQGGEYDVKKLWDIFDVRDGTHDSPKFHDKGYPLITSKNLSENGIDFGNIKLISQEDYDKINQRSKVDKWDLLFAMIGTIWTPTIVDIEPEFAIKNVALFKPKNTDAVMWYLRYFLLSDFVIQKMLAESKWATQKFVGLGYLRAFQIPLPPLPRQHEIVVHLDRVFAETMALRWEYEAQIRDLSTLKQSLLEEAFAGRLITENEA